MARRSPSRLDTQNLDWPLDMDCSSDFSRDGSLWEKPKLHPVPALRTGNGYNQKLSEGDLSRGYAHPGSTL